MPYKGSCHCGSVAYEIERLESLGHCHCNTCRKTHSAAFNTAGRVLKPNFRWLRGENRLKAYESSPGKQRVFCGDCGCHIVAIMQGADYVILRAASLDDDPGLRPQRRIWRSHDAPWLFEQEPIPSFDEFPPA
jgi:ADP-ribosyl-[dinitrogen reductase] hydrolase